MDDLDQNIIPKILASELLINYLFINSELNVIQDIIAQIPISRDTYVYSMNLDEYILEEIQAERDTLNFQLMNRIIELSRNRDYWKKIYIPFTLEDIIGIKGKDGNRVDVPRYAGAIITNKFIQFIVNSKITQKSTTFSSDDFMDFIFKEFFKAVIIGDDKKIAFKRKIILYLDWVAKKLIQEINISEIIRKLSQNRYRIILRNTSTLEDRCLEIRKRAIAFFLQMKITEFF